MKFTNLNISGMPLIQVDVGKALTVFLSPLGASIVAIIYYRYELLMRPEEFIDYKKSNIYYGKTIAPITGRIKDGKVVINDKTYQMEINEGDNTLHSGLNEAISNKMFNTMFSNTESQGKVIFTYERKHNGNGLPGNIHYQVIYHFDDNKDGFELEYIVKSDEDTIISMTNHSYFHLASPDITNLMLEIPASKYIEVDKFDMLPKEEKEVLPCLDFRNMKLVGKDINDSYLIGSKTNGYDHYFVFDEDKKYVRVENSTFGLKIETDFNGVQLYSDNYPDGVKTSITKNIIHRGLAIEPQDSPLARTTLKKDETYHKHISYTFYVKQR